MNYFILADLHGRHEVIDNFYKNHKDILSDNYGENILIILGDLGANYFNDKRDERFKERLSRYPFTYFVIRGNHEERPSECAQRWMADWHKEIYFSNSVWVEDRFPKILYALDEGTNYKIEDKKILVIPGAYSVDKDYRVMNKWFWNPHEQLSADEQKKLLENLEDSYDYIFAHTCANSWIPEITDLFLPQVDQSTVDRTMELFIDKVISQTNFKHFYFGHYHDNRDVFENVTMIFHEPLPLGESYASYQRKSFI